MQDLSGAGRVKMSTVVLMNPDASLQQFLDKDFNALRKVCSHITLYGDNTDGGDLSVSSLGHPCHLCHTRATIRLQH